MISGFALFPHNGGGKWLGDVAPFAGHNRGCAAVLVASGAVGICYGGSCRVVMAYRTVFRNRHMQGMVECYLPIEAPNGVQINAIRHIFGQQTRR